MTSHQSLDSSSSHTICIYPEHTILENILLDFHSNTDTNKIPKELLCNMDVSVHDSTNIPQTDDQPIEESFGCLEIKSGETTINIDPVFFLFTIDESGSMSEICKDGKSKMDHIHFTMNQILHYFAENPEATIYINVIAFHDVVRTVIETTHVTHKNVNDIIDKIKKIRPQNSTNLESALKTANQIMDDHVVRITQKKQSHRIVHILLTDGNPTMGDCSETSLVSLVNDAYSNIFIAFGLDHNPILMNKLGTAGKNTTNYLVKKLELIGHVYGEIVHNQLFKVLDNVILEVDEGLIYDWYSNEWKTILHVAPLTSESKRYYYIKSNNPDKTTVRISGRPIDSYAGTYFEEYVDKLPDLIRIPRIPKIPDNHEETIEEVVEEIVDVDLTKHIFRLCTQRLLYQARKYANGEDEFDTSKFDLVIKRSIVDNHHFEDEVEDIVLQTTSTNTNVNFTLEQPRLQRGKTIWNNDEFEKESPQHHDKPQPQPQPQPLTLILLKEQIKDHLQYMYDYLEKNPNNDPDNFIKTLCDDMKISLQTLGTRNQQTYINARSTSQGTQQMYNVIINDDEGEDASIATNTPNRNINNAYATPTAIKLMRGFSER